MQPHPREASPGGESVRRSKPRHTHGEILEYWTKQRLADAKPRELRFPEEGPRLKQRGADTHPAES